MDGEEAARQRRVVLWLGGAAVAVGAAVSVAGAAFVLRAAQGSWQPFDDPERRPFMEASVPLPDGTRVRLARRLDPGPDGRFDCRVRVVTPEGVLELPAPGACEVLPIAVGWWPGAGDGRVVVASAGGRGAAAVVDPRSGSTWRVLPLPAREGCPERRALQGVGAQAAPPLVVWGAEGCDLRVVGGDDVTLLGDPWDVAVQPLGTVHDRGGALWFRAAAR